MMCSRLQAPVDTKKQNDKVGSNSGANTVKPDKKIALVGCMRSNCARPAGKAAQLHALPADAHLVWRACSPGLHHGHDSCLMFYLLIARLIQQHGWSTLVLPLPHWPVPLRCKSDREK